MLDKKAHEPSTAATLLNYNYSQFVFLTMHIYHWTL